MVLVEPAPVPLRIFTVQPTRPLTGQAAAASVSMSSPPPHLSAVAPESGFGFQLSVAPPETNPVTVPGFAFPTGEAPCGPWQSRQVTWRLAPESEPSLGLPPSPA